MAEFYTIGLPRSRSLWLSFSLSGADSVCMHEALTPFGFDRLPTGEYKYIGSCDTNPLNNVTRDGKAIKIIRPIGDVTDSILKALDNPFSKDFRRFVEKWIEKSSIALGEISAKEYDYSSLNDIDCMVEIQQLLKPTEEIDYQRLCKMLDTRVMTKNRNLIPSIMHTSNYFGLSVDDFYQSVVGGK